MERESLSRAPLTINKTITYKNYIFITKFIRVIRAPSSIASHPNISETLTHDKIANFTYDRGALHLPLLE